MLSESWTLWGAQFYSYDTILLVFGCDDCIAGHYAGPGSVGPAKIRMGFHKADPLRDFHKK